ncbi:hypothetical protein Tco_0227838 [Tanacetum coccineum]
MKNNFEMSMMGELKFFLGLQVHQSPHGVFISQSQYVIELLKKHGRDDCVSMSTHMATKRLDADLQGTLTDQTTYRRMIGELMYLTASCPYITFATFVCAHYQARPTVKHLKEVKRIFRIGMRFFLVKMLFVLKREVGIKQYEINTLKTKFEKVKQEKDAIDLKIEKFGKASKDLDQLLESQITDKILDLENTKTSQAAEITKLKERVKKLERRNKSKTPGLKRLRKVGRSTQVVSSKDKGLGAQEDASKQGRKIADLDADAEEVEVEKAVSTAEVTTASATTTVDELTVAQTLIEIKVAKPKDVTTAATTTTTAVTRPKARGVEVQNPSQLNAELEEEEKLATQREEDANIAEWDNVQAMIDADYELAARLQVQEQEELTVEEKSKSVVELMDKRKKHFARLRSEDQRRKPLTKAQKRNQMCTYLKNMAGFTHSQLKNKIFDELEQERIKKKKIDDDQEEAEMKKHMEIVVDEEEIAVDAIPLATKPPNNRSRKDKDKDEDPFAGSDRGLKKRKTSKDAEPTKGPKAKEPQSVSSKALSLNQNCLERTICKEPEFEVADFGYAQVRGNLVTDYEEPRRKVESKRD